MPQDMPMLIVKNFPGAVLLKHWTAYPSGRSHIGFTGEVSILSDKEALGFEVRGQDSNWIARIQGPTSSVNVPGCQVAAVYEGPDLDPKSSDFLAVP